MQKMPCQPIRSVRAPPMIGAVTGATPLIAPITASMRPSSAPENLSVATEREMTMPPDAATPSDEPHGDELFDALCRDAEYGRYQEERHGCEQRPAAAVFVAQRAEEELSDGQSDHAGRQSHLDHRRRSGEESRHRRERRQVHVRDEGAEGREHAQQDQQKESRIVVLHVSYLF